jgi:Transposase DNA-binding
MRSESEAGSGLREWAEEEFGGAMLNDWRMQDRVVMIGEAMASQPGVGIGEMFGRVADVRAAYRFFEHGEATPENLRYGHQERVELRMREAGVYLMLEDTTEVECSAGGGIEGLGPIGGSRTGGRGFLLHTTLVVKWEDERERARRPGLERNNIGCGNCSR